MAHVSPLHPTLPNVHHVWELTPERLGQWGLCALLLDVDCTLSRYRQGEALPEVVAWIEQLRTAGVRLCLVSNGMGAANPAVAERLDLPCVAKAMKPLPWGLWSAMEKLKPRHRRRPSWAIRCSPT